MTKIIVYNDIKFKSSLELDVYKQTEANDIKALYEKEKLSYIIPESEHNYTPDFKIKKVNGGIMYIECKGVGPRYGLTVETRRKMLYVKERYPYIDLRFVFWNAYATLTAHMHSQKYHEWAEENSFPWCHRKIPLEWFKLMEYK